MIVVYHVTVAAAMKSIRRHGLLTSKATGRRKAVWFVSEEMIPWALLHVMTKRKVPLDHLRIVCVGLEPTHLNRSRYGLLYCELDICVSCILSVSSPELTITDPAD